MTASEIQFAVGEDETDGGYLATEPGFGMHAQGDTIEDLRRSVREVVACYFDEVIERPYSFRLHFVRDMVPAA